MPLSKENIFCNKHQKQQKCVNLSNFQTGVFFRHATFKEKLFFKITKGYIIIYAFGNNTQNELNFKIVCLK